MVFTLAQRAERHVLVKYLSTLEGSVITSLLSRICDRSPHVFESALVYCALVQEYRIEYGCKKPFTSAGYLYKFFTGDDPKQYCRRGTVFIASLTPYINTLISRCVLTPSSRTYSFGDESTAHARSLRLTSGFYLLFQQAVKEELQCGRLLPYMFGQKPCKRTIKGTGWQKNLDRMHPNLIAMFRAIQQGSFVIDVAAVESIRDATPFITDENGKESLARLYCIRSALETIALTSTPQHHDAIHLQRSGRRHTIGGLQSLPRDIRRMILKPLKKDHVLVDYDLECCQLMLGARELGATRLLAKLTQILESGQSVWKAMQIDVPKGYLKKAVYAILFMCDKRYIVDLVNSQEKEKLFTQEHCEKLLVFLEDLMDKRDKWQDKHPRKHIVERHNGEQNDLGLQFQVEEQSRFTFTGDQYSEMMDVVDTKNPQSQYLAWRMQSREQFIITSLVNDMVTYPIVCDCHDGFLVSMPKQDVQAATERYRQYLKDNFAMYLKGEVWEDGEVIPVDQYQANVEQDVVQVPSFQSSTGTFGGGGGVCYI